MANDTLSMSRIIDDINRVDLLSAEVVDESKGLIEIEYLGKCGNEEPADMIERVYKNDALVFVSDDAACNIVFYRLGA